MQQLALHLSIFCTALHSLQGGALDCPNASESSEKVSVQCLRRHSYMCQCLRSAVVSACVPTHTTTYWHNKPPALHKAADVCDGCKPMY